jgi:hypothetical protein
MNVFPVTTEAEWVKQLRQSSMLVEDDLNDVLMSFKVEGWIQPGAYESPPELLIGSKETEVI